MPTFTQPEVNAIKSDLQYVLLPSGSVVHQNGVPVTLITGALVTTAYGNMSQLVGYHLGPAPTGPCNPPQPSDSPALPTIEQVSGCIDFGGVVRFNNETGKFEVRPVTEQLSGTGENEG